MFGTLQITEKDLTLSNKLGDGAFASVYRYVDPVSKKTYAVKCFKADVSLEVVKEEIFGPVLCLVRAKDLNESLDIINASRYANAAAIYTQNGGAAREFKYRARCGNLGINIGVAAPMAFFHFGGSKDSFYGDLHAQGKDAFEFYTDAVVVVERWY